MATVPECTCEQWSERVFKEDPNCPRHKNPYKCKDHLEFNYQADRFRNEYVAHGEWMEKLSKTHEQKVCGECGLWKIWIKK